MEESPSKPAGYRERFIRTAGLVLFALVLRQTAWLCDDAYITFRTLDNIVSGYGPTWNVSERVQGYTHPLWMLTLIIPYAVSGPFAFYYTCIVISMALSLAAAACVCLGVGRSPGRSLLAAVLLCASKAFTEYSTSGLENPLTHLLLGLFLIIVFRAEPPEEARESGNRRLFTLALLACLGWLNRMDSILLFAPSLLVALAERRNESRWRAATAAAGVTALAFIPALLWVMFSIFYYGFPFPNTAYAKLSHGIPQSMLLAQSGWYFVNSLSWDTITLPVIALGTALGFAGRSRRDAAVAVGIILHLLYVARIGGDFMSGRFFAAPFFCAVALVVRSPVIARPALPFALSAAAALSVLLSPRSVLHTDQYFGNNADLEGIIMDRHLIADERMFYFQASGLLPDLSGGARHNGMPRSHYAYEGVRDRMSGVRVKNQAAVGFYGFFAGPDVYVIDSYALCNAFLARTPARRFDYYEGTIWSDYHWRIGHFERWLPAGYVETLETGVNRIEDPELAEFHDRLNFVITGDLFAPDRFREIIRLNTGAYDHLLAAARARGKAQWEDAR